MGSLREAPQKITQLTETHNACNQDCLKILQVLYFPSPVQLLEVGGIQLQTASEAVPRGSRYPSAEVSGSESYGLMQPQTPTVWYSDLWVLMMRIMFYPGAPQQKLFVASAVPQSGLLLLVWHILWNPLK